MTDKQDFMPDFWKRWLSDAYGMSYEDLVAYVREHGDTPVSGPMGQVKKVLNEVVSRDYVNRLGKKGDAVTFRKVD